MRLLQQGGLIGLMINKQLQESADQPPDEAFNLVQQVMLKQFLVMGVLQYTGSCEGHVCTPSGCIKREYRVCS